MDPQRKAAYRYLLYAALLHLRTPGWRGPGPWWNLTARWNSASHLREKEALADCFHNLAKYSVQDFEGFDETLFWRDVDCLGQACGTEHVKRYRGIFDDYVAGHTRLF